MEALERCKKRHISHEKLFMIKRMLLRGDNINQISKRLKMNYGTIKRLKLMVDNNGYDPNNKEDAEKLINLRQQFKSDLLDALSSNPFEVYTVRALAEIVNAPYQMASEILSELTDGNFVYRVRHQEYTSHEDAMDFYDDCTVEQEESDDLG